MDTPLRRQLKSDGDYYQVVMCGCNK